MPRKAKRGRRPGRPKGSGGATSWASAASGLKSYRNTLATDRDALDEKIGALDSALDAMGAGAPAARGPARRSAGKPGPKPGPGPGRGRRGPRKGSLKEYITKVLGGRVRGMAVKDITTSVLRSGYKSKNKTLAKSVGIALADMRGVSKLGRGVYQLK